MSSAGFRGSPHLLPSIVKDVPPRPGALHGPVGFVPRTVQRRCWREPRFACRVACRVRELGGASPTVQMGQAVNISGGGLALLVARAMVQGTRVEVLLLSSQAESNRVTGEVAHSRRVLSGTFEVGVRLQRVHVDASVPRSSP